MTFPRSTRAVLAVALFGLVQFGLVADARADLPSASALAQNALTHGGVFCGLPQFKAFTAWSSPVILSTTVNTQYEESAPAISPDGRSLYFNRNFNGRNPDSTKVDEDIFVSYRSNRNKPWGAPVAVDVLNTATYHERNVALSRDGSMLFFSSDRLVNDVAVGLDLYVSQRKHKGSHGPDQWRPPTNLGPVVNSASNDIGPGYFDAGKRGTDVLYFTSNRPGGPGLLDIYASARGANGSFGLPVLVPELSGTTNDARPVIRADGLEAVLQSDRQPSAGLGDMWVSSRTTLSQPWGPPVNLGPVLNTTFQDRQAALSDDAETLYFASTRPGVGADDIWMSTREKASR
jgi:hypothetical protein